MKRVLLLFLLVAVYIYSINIISKMYIADIFFVAGKTKVDTNNYQQGVDYYTRAINLNPMEPAYLRNRAKAYLAQSLLGDADYYKEMALKDLEASQSLNSNNLATTRNIVPLYYFLAISTSQEGDEVLTYNDPYYSVVASNYYSSLKNKYPNDLGIIADIAEYEYKLGFEDDFMKSVEIVKELRPDLLGWHSAFVGR